MCKVRRLLAVENLAEVRQKIIWPNFSAMKSHRVINDDTLNITKLKIADTDAQSRHRRTKSTRTYLRWHFKRVVGYASIADS